MRVRARGEVRTVYPDTAHNSSHETPSVGPSLDLRVLVKVGSGSDALPMHDGYPRDILRLAVLLLRAGRVAPHDPPTSLSQELAKQLLLISITANLL